MSKSKEYIEGFKDALNKYSWVGNDKQLRVGLPPVLLIDAIMEIEKEREPEPVIQTPPEEIIPAPRSRKKIYE